ncbi:MAG: hypothetical protein GY910_22470 [bacterium]|nr:hypothetical protein [bacterium]
MRLSSAAGSINATDVGSADVTGYWIDNLPMTGGSPLAAGSPVLDFGAFGESGHDDRAIPEPSTTLFVGWGLAALGRPGRRPASTGHP